MASLSHRQLYHIRARLEEDHEFADNIRRHLFPDPAPRIVLLQPSKFKPALKRVVGKWQRWERDMMASLLEDSPEEQHVVECLEALLFRFPKDIIQFIKRWKIPSTELVG
jgi:hypothetical protein